MAKTYTHPHWEISVIDKSIYTPLVREELPSLLPIFFMRAQQGPTGVPVYVSGSNAATTKFGDGTFDSSTKYYSREALFLNGLFARQGAFIVRMASSDAKYGSVVLEVKVKKTQVKQYERDVNGQFVLDEETGDKLPLRNEATGEQLTEPGLELTWNIRPLALDKDHPESVTNLKPTTYGEGENAYTVYPILAVKADSVGAFANDIGIKLFADIDNVDDTLATNLGSFPYSFGIVKKTYGQDTVSAILSSWNNQFETFVAKPNQIDSRVERSVSFDEVIEDNYRDLPFSVQLYSENIATIGAMIQEVEPDDTTLTDPYLVNIFEPYNIEDVPMPHVVLGEDSVRLNSDRICYLQGGADGQIDDEAIEALTRQYLNDLVYPAIRDQARYPFSAIFDTGVSLETKEAFIKFLGVRDDFRLYLSTQNANLGRYNTQAEDYSSGSALFAKCLLQPESSVKGTECCRADIYQQSGKLADSTYRGIVPFTYDIMLKKSRYASTGTISGQPAGLPNSEVNVFKEWNWTPSDPDLKQKSWDSGLNYAQHYDMTGIHWPAMRTVYRYDTSVLSNSLFADVVTYIKHLARYNWSRYVGVEAPFATIKANAEESLANDINGLLAGRYTTTVEYSQSEEEAKIGYMAHCDISITGDPQTRVWKYNIICYRSGYETEEA